MVLKIYCDVCGKEVKLFDKTPGMAVTDPGAGQTVAVALNDMAFDALELCEDHTNAFLKLWEEFRKLGEKEVQS